MGSNFGKKILAESGNYFQIQNEPDENEIYYEIGSEYLADYLTEHICSVCGEAIKIGQSYEQSKGTYDNTWTEYKICFFCLENKPNFIMEPMEQNEMEEI